VANSKTSKLYFVAGEASGDARGAELMRALHEREPAMEFHGLGGPQMKAIAGGSFRDWIDRAGVIGFVDVLKNYGWFRQQFDAALAEILATKPDALVLIDYPGFNLRLAKAVKAANPAQRIIYYISPQVWAWNRGRIPRMARTLDLMLCIFPFEKPLYEKSGLRTEFVGHPMVESLGAKRTGAPREEGLIALLPGSRKREVKKIFPAMLEAAREMLKRHPGLRFEASAASEEMGERMHGILAHCPGLKCEVVLRGAHDLMQRASAGMVASGTATLEAAFFGLPHVIVYKVSGLTFFIARRLVKVPHIGIVNIMAGREIVREFLQKNAQPDAIADGVLSLVEDADARERTLAAVGQVLAQLGGPGASRHAADAILAELGKA
jgi:lipid-A-disaccharide synthase